MSDPIASVNRYRVRPESLDAFLDVMDRHWPLLRDLELVTDREVELFVGAERETRRPVVVEIFDWVDEDASRRAHTHPDVSAVWDAIGPLCESRGEQSPFEFANLRRLAR